MSVKKTKVYDFEVSIVEESEKTALVYNDQATLSVTFERDIVQDGDDAPYWLVSVRTQANAVILDGVYLPVALTSDIKSEIEKELSDYFGEPVLPKDDPLLFDF